MIKSYKVLSDFPRPKLSPVTLGEFSRLIESAYHDDLLHGRLDDRARYDVLSCVIERFRQCDGYPGAKQPLELWSYRRKQLSEVCGE